MNESMNRKFIIKNIYIYFLGIFKQLLYKKYDLIKKKKLRDL